MEAVTITLPMKIWGIALKGAILGCNAEQMYGSFLRKGAEWKIKWKLLQYIGVILG